MCINLTIYLIRKGVRKMPRFDGTGPMGQGPKTGRGFGPCFGWGRRGQGRGLGRYFGWDQPQTKEEQKKDLSEYIKALKEEMEDVEKEMSDLGK